MLASLSCCSVHPLPGSSDLDPGRFCKGRCWFVEQCAAEDLGLLLFCPLLQWENSSFPSRKAFPSLPPSGHSQIPRCHGTAPATCSENGEEPMARGGGKAVQAGTGSSFPTPEGEKGLTVALSWPGDTRWGRDTAIRGQVLQKRV